MAFYKEVGKNTESTTLDNRVVSTDDLRVKVKQILQERQWHQIEPVEVVDVITDTEVATKQNIQYGKIIGRYIYSDRNVSLSEISSKTFRPLGSNIIQLPIIGEVVMGIEFFGERFYLPMSMVKTFKNKLDELPRLNYSHKNISSIGEAPIDSSDVQGTYFRDTNKSKLILKEGDTAIQGRFGNYITLSSNQIADLTDELGEGALEKVNETFLNSPNIELNVDKFNSSGSKILMTTSQSVQYPEQVVEFGKSMKKIQPEGVEFVTQDYSDGQVYIDAERIVFNASKDDVAIFANKRVHIKGGNGGVQISNAKGSVSIKAKEIVEDFKDGKKIQINKSLTKGDVILAPDNMQEMGAVLAKQVEWNLDFIKVQIGSLVPAGIPGLPKFKVNPVWFKNVKDKIKNAKRLLEFNDLVLKLKWLDKSKWKTYTMKELKEAFKPIPGFGSIIGGFASLKQLKGNIDNVKDQIDEKVKALEAIKSGELLDVANVVNGLKDDLVDGAIENLGLEKAQDLRNKIEDLEKTGQTISKFTGGRGLKQRLDTYTKLEEEVQQSFSTDPGYQSLVKRRDEASEKLNSYVARGSADGFDQRISEIDIEVQAFSGGMDLLEAMVEVQDEAEKIESVTS